MNLPFAHFSHFAHVVTTLMVVSKYVETTESQRTYNGGASELVLGN